MKVKVEKIKQDKDALLRSLAGKVRDAYAQGRYGDALEACRMAQHMAPELAQSYADAAACCVKIDRWDDAIAHALAALERGPESLAALDVLSHAWWAKAWRNRHAIGEKGQSLCGRGCLHVFPPCPGIQDRRRCRLR